MLKPGDDLAKLFVRALVLGSDLVRESVGIRPWDGQGASIDEITYFVRRQAQTLYSARALLEGIRGDPTFKVWLGAEPDTRQRFDAAKKEFDQRRSLIEKVRKEIGGHAEASLADAVIRLSAREPEFSIGEIAPNDVDGLHAGIAGTFCSSVIISAYRGAKGRRMLPWHAAMEGYIAEARAASEAFIRCMELFVDVYLKERPHARQAIRAALTSEEEEDVDDAP